MKETKKHIDFRAMSREEIETYAVSMTDKVEQLSLQLSWYEEQLRLSRKKRFGASSEKTDAAQINMFNEAESEAQEDRKEPSMGEVKPPASRKKKGHKEQLLKPLPKDADAKHAKAAVGLAYCNRLFAVERACEEKELDYEARRVYRMEHAKPVWEAFLTWAKDTLPQALPKSKLHETLQYVSKQAIPLGN